MSTTLSKQVRDYFAHSRKVTFAGSDKAEIYALLHHAEQLIALLLRAASPTRQLKQSRKMTLIQVRFESHCHAEHVAVMRDDIYQALLSGLERLAKRQRMIVTESERDHTDIDDVFAFVDAREEAVS